MRSKGRIATENQLQSYTWLQQTSLLKANFVLKGSVCFEAMNERLLQWIEE